MQPIRSYVVLSCRRGSVFAFWLRPAIPLLEKKRRGANRRKIGRVLKHRRCGELGEASGPKWLTTHTSVACLKHFAISDDANLHTCHQTRVPYRLGKIPRKFF